MDADIIIVGAGPAGLCLAQSLTGCGLRILLVEQQAESALQAPEFDGREIALTQHSATLMRQLGLWERIAPDALAPLRDARVMDGSDPFAMVIGHQLGSQSELGWLVSNHLIRQAAWEAVAQSRQQHQDIDVLCGTRVVALQTDEQGGSVTLDDQRRLRARLVVAADSRFSTTRRMMGIAAHMHDFGKNMLVCCMTHEKPHDYAAWEWFGYGQTLALLPMNPDPQSGKYRSSVVITLDSRAIERLKTCNESEFNAEVAQRFESRLGTMQLSGSRHSYPLVAVFPQRLVAQRFACVGDAAVGMHPVTAHGFNFGLLSVEGLSTLIKSAQAAQADIATDALLQRYARRQARATLPLFLATRLVVELYTHDSTPARLLRKGLLRLGDAFVPLKRSIAQSLSGM